MKRNILILTLILFLSWGCSTTSENQQNSGENDAFSFELPNFSGSNDASVNQNSQGHSFETVNCALKVDENNTITFEIAYYRIPSIKMHGHDCATVVDDVIKEVGDEVPRIVLQFKEGDLEEGKTYKLSELPETVKLTFLINQMMPVDDPESNEFCQQYLIPDDEAPGEYKCGVDFWYSYTYSGGDSKTDITIKVDQLNPVPRGYVKMTLIPKIIHYKSHFLPSEAKEGLCCMGYGLSSDDFPPEIVIDSEIDENLNFVADVDVEHWDIEPGPCDSSDKTIEQILEEGLCTFHP